MSKDSKDVAIVESKVECLSVDGIGKQCRYDKAGNRIITEPGETVIFPLASKSTDKRSGRVEIPMEIWAKMLEMKVIQRLIEDKEFIIWEGPANLEELKEMSQDEPKKRGPGRPRK